MLSSDAEAWSEMCGDAVFVSRFNHPITSEARCALATLVAWMENTALYERAHWQLFCCGNRKVAAAADIL